MTEFVDGWILGDVLGEGAYGEVRLVVNKANGEAVAMKMVDLGKHPDARNTVKKETTIHRMLFNPYIIQYFGQRSESNMEYIFLEYASGGELFDRIEPDIGMPLDEARKYFKQLIIAVEYLHSRGVAHRDLKPENLLLDDHDNLKVSDFGLATIYRLNGKERLLDKKCGTLPYVAPEVLERPYHAEPADIWSCGIILVALLAGELPWDQALADCTEYILWKQGNYLSQMPWRKLDRSSLVFIEKILVHTPSDRKSLSDIQKQPWYLAGYDTGKESTCTSTSEKIKISEIAKQPICLSQPELPPFSNNSSPAIRLDRRIGLSFSQPTTLEDLLVSSQVQALNTQTSQSSFQNLVRRMTRFFASTNCEDTMKIITECLNGKNYNYRLNNFGMITITTVDKRKMPLIFKINIIDMDNKTMVDFRLSKGCGIEFKKEFLKIREIVRHIKLKSCDE